MPPLHLPVFTQPEMTWTISKHRKITSSFRDSQLFDIFQLACDMLRKALEMLKTFDFNDSSQVSPIPYKNRLAQHQLNIVCVWFQHGLLTFTLQLANNCLTYDFIGTSADESSDDLSTVQIPTSWRGGSTTLTRHSIKLSFSLDITKVVLLFLYSVS